MSCCETDTPLFSAFFCIIEGPCISSSSIDSVLSSIPHREKCYKIKCTDNAYNSKTQKVCTKNEDNLKKFHKFHKNIRCSSALSFKEKKKYNNPPVHTTRHYIILTVNDIVTCSSAVYERTSYT